MTLQQIKTLVDEAKHKQPPIIEDLCKAIELLLADRAELIEALEYVIDHSMPNTYNNEKAIKVLKKSKERLGE